MIFSILQKVYSLRYVLGFSVVSYFLFPVYKWIPLVTGLMIYTVFYRENLWFYWICSQIVVVGAILVSTVSVSGPAYLPHVCLLTICYFAILFLITKLKPRQGLAMYLAVGLVLLYLQYYQRTPWLAGFLSAFFFFWASNFFAILIDMRNQNGWNQGLVKWYNPPWSFFGFLPLASKYLDQNKEREINGIIVWQGKGLQLTVICAVLLAIQNIFYSWVLANGGQIDPSAMITGGANIELWHWVNGYFRRYYDPKVSLWLATYTGAIMSVIKIIFLYGFCVSVARMFGYRFQLFPYPILAMASFSRFYGNLLHYYNKVLIQAFYPVLYKKFRRLGAELNHKLSFFLTIFLGGIAAHFIFNLRRMDLFPTLQILVLKTLQFGNYSLILATIALFVRQSPSIQSQSKWILLLRFFVTFTLYSIIVSANVLFFRKDQTWSEFMEYLRLMFF